MNWEALHDRLIRAARLHAPGDQVPYAFEKRVVARLPAPVADDWNTISRALGWATGVFSAVALAMSVWSYAPDSSADNFTDDLEETILASFGDHGVEADLDLLH